MSGTLYIVGTPIGNLGDISERALKTLNEADFIAAEDTRVTLKLLNRFEIRKPLVSYHEHSRRETAEAILSRIASGKNGALVSDAGMPCISDPGELLVRLCYEKGIPVRVVPGPSAAVSALAISGIDTSRFSFEGFLSVTKKQRISHLREVSGLRRTMIFYEAPHKLLYTLKDMLAYFGNRRISLCRELTKIHEEVVLTTLEEAVRIYEEKTPRGEFVLIVEGAPQSSEQPLDFDEACARVRALVSGGDRLADACKTVAADTGYKKSALYTALLE